MAHVLSADVAQLAQWSAFLPAPASDVERTVAARIARRLTLLSDDTDPTEGDQRPGVEDSVAQVRALLGLVGQSNAFAREFSVH
jgi:hypothetical protein